MKNDKKWQLLALEDLNSSCISSEKHSVEVISKIDDILELTEDTKTNLDTIRTIAFDLINNMQHHDLNRQKVQRAMNLIIENENISKDELKESNIKCVSPSAKHIDSEDGESISDEELEKLISSSQ